MKAEKNRVQGEGTIQRLGVVKELSCPPAYTFRTKVRGGTLLVSHYILHFSECSPPKGKIGDTKAYLFHSRTLLDPETRYSVAEKLVVAMIYAKDKF